MLTLHAELGEAELVVVVTEHVVKILACQFLLILEARLPEHRLDDLLGLISREAVVRDFDEGPRTKDGRFSAQKKLQRRAKDQRGVMVIRSGS